MVCGFHLSLKETCSKKTDLVNRSNVCRGSLLSPDVLFPFLLTPSQGSQTTTAPDALHSSSHSDFHLRPVFLRWEDRQGRS